MIRAELERRPLLILCLGLVVGLTLARHPIHLIFLIPVPWALITLRARGLLVVGLAGGALLGPLSTALLIQNQFVSGEWVIRTMPRIQTFGQSCEIQQGDLKLALLYDGGLRLCPGSIARVRGVAKPPDETNEGYFRSRGLVGKIELKGDALQVERDGPWLQNLACRWRAGFLDFTSTNLPPQAASVVDSMCFHVDGLLDKESREEVMRTGTIHLFSASGLQIILIAMTLQWLLQWLPIPRWLQIGLLAFVLILYAVATGSQPSIIRAVAMSLAADSAYLFKREPDWPSALALTSILYLLWFPLGIYDPGFQLSFIAVLFLSMFREHSRWKTGAEAKAYLVVRRTVRTTLFAYLVIAPLTANFFGTISLLTVPISLLTLVAAVPVVIVAMSAYPLSLVLPSMGGFAIKATIPLTTFIYKVLDTYGGAGAEIQTPPFSPYWLILYYLFLLMLWRPHVRRP